MRHTRIGGGVKVLRKLKQRCCHFNQLVQVQCDDFVIFIENFLLVNLYFTLLQMKFS